MQMSNYNFKYQDSSKFKSDPSENPVFKKVDGGGWGHYPACRVIRFGSISQLP